MKPSTLTVEAGMGCSSLKRQITEKCVKKQPVSELIRNIVRIQENKFGIDSDSSKHYDVNHEICIPMTGS